jgi:catechol 2,3-dioxygenase-like lactoylglutathione lyase family enzyme
MNTAPAVTGILETALYVADLERSAAFYRDLFDFEILVRDARFCALKVGDRQVLLLFVRGASREPIPVGQNSDAIPPHDGNGHLHFAFSIPAESLEPWRTRLAEKGLPIASTIHWPHTRSTSLYFHDPDGHVLELATPGIWGLNW